MPAFRDRTGEKVGRLTVICEASRHPTSNRVRWLCQCDCGNEIVVTGGSLRVGNSSSCGCLQSERTASANVARTKHGHARSGGGNKRLTSPEYRSWKAMLERIRNPNSPNYHLYGGRGITVCQRWLGESGFSNFLADMGPRPNGKSIDRIDVDGNYEPDNCRWATLKEQRRNQRNSPELEAKRIAALGRGREHMWADPEIRDRLIASRRKKKRT